MKKTFGVGVILLGASALFAQNGNSQYGRSYDSYSQSGSQSQQQAAPQGGQMAPSDCDHLSQQEQVFASQLSSMHRTVFCRHFSVSQRIEAMTLAKAGAKDLTGGNAEITPDQAVEVVMKNAREDKGQSSDQTSDQNQKGKAQGNYGGSYGSSSQGSSSSNPYSNY
ncbi:MAG: hypothetical protein HRU43_02330 [Simkaniaceae bacterium]|nr:hypothetical protein [Simkaniaceae bacterium]